MEENLPKLNKHILFGIDVKEEDKQLYRSMGKTFCGIHVKSLAKIKALKDLHERRLYLCGDLSKVKEIIDPLVPSFEGVYYVAELSYNYVPSFYHKTTLGQIPTNVHNVGVFFRRYFDANGYFERITSEHKFQTLTQHKKTGRAYRTGIYLTPIREEKKDLYFHLLRCSTNFGPEGPTDNFRDTDDYVVGEVNKLARAFFQQPVKFNHVLAQVYHNQRVLLHGKMKPRKAAISEHSDKTKDMPANALMAFVSFYEEEGGETYPDSAFTRLRFRLKGCVKDPSYTKQFDITLYPNSVFMMSLLTNRLYTHEIIPSSLPIEQIPTRMGYVMRCSDRKAVHSDGSTYIFNPHRVELKPQTAEGVRRLKKLYKLENATARRVKYDGFDFSMNEGDYAQPTI